MTIAMLLVFVVPFWIAVSTIVEYSDNIQEWATSLKEIQLPMPPDWVERLPLVGPKIAATWSEYAAQTPEALAAKLAPYVGQGLRWLAAEAGGIGLLVVQFLLTIVIAAVMYSGGETAASGIRKFGARFAGQARRGCRAARLPRDPRRRARRRRHRARPGAARRASGSRSPAFPSPAC